MLNHFSAKLPKLSKLMIGWHGPNICIEIGAPPNHRRAEGYLYVWERCLYRAASPLHVCGKRPPRAEASSCPPGAAKVWSQFVEIQLDAKVLGTPRRRILYFSVHFGQTCKHVPARFVKRADMCLLWRRGAQVEVPPLSGRRPSQGGRPCPQRHDRKM